MDSEKQKILEVTDLSVSFKSEFGEAIAVDGISFHVKKGEILGVVGESGCGKSVSSLAVMRLIQEPPGKIKSGEVRFGEKDLLKLSPAQMRKIRGNRIAMIFQDPMTSLNPVFTCGNQVAEAIRLHQDLDKKSAWDKTIQMFEKVGIPNPAQRVHEYPHELSGGLRQRVMIAMALSCNPQLLIADEPTTALDVTIQKQILELIKRLQKDFDMSVMLITHDLGVIAEIADRIIVMYSGKIVEEGTTEQVLYHPRHPYTQGLLKSLPGISGSRDNLPVIEGNVPDLHDRPSGCAFHPRCGLNNHESCQNKAPKLEDVGAGQRVSCWEKALTDTRQKA